MEHAATETYNGSSWTETGGFKYWKTYGHSAGFNCRSFSIGTPGPRGAMTTATETWNGSSWTEVSDINVSRIYGRIQNMEQQQQVCIWKNISRDCNSLQMNHGMDLLGQKLQI